MNTVEELREAEYHGAIRRQREIVELLRREGDLEFLIAEIEQCWPQGIPPIDEDISPSLGASGAEHPQEIHWKDGLAPQQYTLGTQPQESYDVGASDAFNSWPASPAGAASPQLSAEAIASWCGVGQGEERYDFVVKGLRRMLAPAAPQQPSGPSPLHLSGVAGDPIWTMTDGAEPHVIGLRLDCGDSGVVYMTPEQARETADNLIEILRQLNGTERRISKRAASPSGKYLTNDGKLASDRRHAEQPSAAPPRDKNLLANFCPFCGQAAGPTCQDETFFYYDDGTIQCEDGCSGVFALVKPPKGLDAKTTRARYDSDAALRARLQQAHELVRQCELNLRARQIDVGSETYQLWTRLTAFLKDSAQ